MSAREQKLLLVFSLAGFAIINFLLFDFATTKRVKVDAQRSNAAQQLATAEAYRASSAEVIDEMDWLAEHEPEPTANQDAQTGLQQLAEREAKSTGLTIKTQKPLPTDATEGRHYHRAKLQITVTGTEEQLYRWLDRLNDPEKFRSATQLRISPNTQDDTKIDCAATIEQWFIPPPPA
ncbi:MAG: hypothetical protein RLZZ245_1506 [Verrucomicrobiota bacterium]|jgi:hypothetical protein